MTRWQKLGRLTYLGPARAPKFQRDRTQRWGWFHCECGTVKRMRVYMVTTSRSRSCGCQVRVACSGWHMAGVAEARARKRAALARKAVR
jgi:hypothetical protein